jgi:CheY-like chemotaxis protein
MKHCGNPLVLLIDDDRDIHDAVRAMLRPLGCRLVGCWTGPSGLAELRRNHPDVLLLDIMLSEPNEGLSIAREIRDDTTLRDIPIILISSIGKSIDSSILKGDLVNAYLEKPLSADALQQAVRRAAGIDQAAGIDAEAQVDEGAEA